MSTETQGPPDGLKEAASPASDDDYDTEWVDRPQPGEVLHATLLAIKHDRGEHDSEVIEARLEDAYGEHEEDDLVCFWSTGGITATLENEENGVRRGDEFAIECTGTSDLDGDDVRNYKVYC